MSCSGKEDELLGNPLAWQVVDDPHEEHYHHVVPMGDMFTHEFRFCWCVPLTDGYAVTHNSYDHREDYFEHCTRKVN